MSMCALSRPVYLFEWLNAFLNFELDEMCYQKDKEAWGFPYLITYQTYIDSRFIFSYLIIESYTLKASKIKR